MKIDSESPIVPFVDLSTDYLSCKEEYLAAIDAVCSQSSFILGGSVERFESEFANFLQTDYCVGVANGTDALTLSFQALGLGAGDEVIVPAHTFIATIIGVLEAGATPVLVDIDPTTYLMDYSKLESLVTKKTKAICPVHLYGRVCDMDRLRDFAEEHRLVIVEDAAQAHGARWRDIAAGTFGDCAAFSFYPAKNLGCFGDGGAITTKDASIAKKLRAMRNYGSEVKYHHPARGGNSRLDAIQAEILRIKLRKLAQANKSRYEAARLYNALLPSSVAPPELPRFPEHIFHLYVVQVPNRERVQNELLAKGIQTGIHYPIPNHLQEGYRSLGYARGDFPVTEDVCSRIVSLPMFSGITNEQVERVSTALIDVL